MPSDRLYTTKYILRQVPSKSMIPVSTIYTAAIIKYVRWMLLLLLVVVGVTLPRLMRAYWVILLSPSLALLCSPYSGSILLTITGTSDAHCSGLLPSMALLKLVTWCQDHAYLITQHVFCPGKLQFLPDKHMIVYFPMLLCCIGSTVDRY